MSAMIPYERVKIVADALKADGLDDWAEGLLKAHVGIFNGTELYMKWRWHIGHILRLQTISADTRKKAEQLYSILDDGLR